MPKGTVKWFNRKKGYGFIVSDDGKELFVHYSKIKTDGFKALDEGSDVKYEIIDTDKGQQAAEVEQL